MNNDDSMDRLLHRASRTRATTRPAEACLDAGMLAALAEGTLTPAERTAAEAHAADCDRCLAVLAAIAKTTPVPATPAKPAWLPFRWLVPLTTAALGLTVWVLVQDRTAPSVSPPPAAVLEDKSAKADTASGQPQQDITDPARTETLQKKADTEFAARAKERQRSADAAAKPGAAADRLDSVQPRSQATETRPSAPAPPAAASPRAVARPEPFGQKDERVLREAAALRAPIEVVSPDATVRWRIVGRTIERSSDGGPTWRAQTTAAAGDPLAGASPAPTVCWIVGRRGLVLLTTDGENWRPLSFPDQSVELSGVTAQSANDAIVIATDGRRWHTTDGGRSWTLQENRRAPF